MRLLIIAPAPKGHLNDYTALAQELVARRIEVEFALVAIELDPSSEGQLQRLGFTVHTLRNWYPAQLPNSQDQSSNNAEGRIARLCRFMTEPANGVERLVEVIAARRPDCVIGDPLCYHAYIAAKRANCPVVSIHTSLSALAPPEVKCERTICDEFVTDARRQMFDRYDVEPPPFRRLVIVGPTLNTFWTTQSVLGALIDPPPGPTALVGPSVYRQDRGDFTGDFPWDRLQSDRPVVYVSFGSGYRADPDRYKTIARAATRLEAQCVLQVHDPETLEVPPGVLVVRYAPQLRLLQRSQLFLTHGGSSSFMEAISSGVPMLVSPVGSDQFIQAYFTEKLGVGFQLDAAADEDETYALMKRLLQEPSVRTKAAELRDSYGAENGCVAAANRIVELVDARP